MVFDPPKPRRRWLRWMVPLVLVVVALVAVAASDAGGKTRAELEYLDRIADQSEQLALGGDALRDVVSRLSRIDRPEFVTVIDNLRAEIAVGLELAAEDPPSEELFAVRALYRLALQNWESGVGGFGSGVLAAADNPEQTAPTDLIANSIVSLRAGDSLFEQLREEFDRLDTPDPVKQVRIVILSPAAGEAIALAVAYTEAARSENSGLALRPGLALSQVVADPEWQLNPDNFPIVPATDVITFSVIITNVGNLTSPPEQVGLTLTAVGGGEPITLALPVPPLDPGAQTTVTFDPMPVEPGESYEAAAVIIVSGADTSFEDNEISVEFRVNTE
jgi:hypothetical protein